MKRTNLSHTSCSQFPKKLVKTTLGLTKAKWGSSSVANFTRVSLVQTHLTPESSRSLVSLSIWQRAKHHSSLSGESLKNPCPRTSLRRWMQKRRAQRHRIYNKQYLSMRFQQEILNTSKSKRINQKASHLTKATESLKEKYRAWSVAALSESRRSQMLKRTNKIWIKHYLA